MDAAKRADAIIVVADALDDPAEAVEEVLTVTEEKHLRLDRSPPEDLPRGMIWKRALLVLTKAEEEEVRQEALAVAEMYGERLPSICVSTILQDGLDVFAARTFDILNIVRIYSQKPGQKADTTNPFILPKGSSVEHFAKVVHNEVANTLKSARVWGSAKYPGQHVERSHVLQDGDVVEVLTR
jgi:ribosome-interacting GTPase 1